MLRRNVSRFVILFPGRTGSTYLISAIDRHPDVEAKGEMLDGLREAGVDAQRAWLEKYLRAPFIGDHRAVGFKTKLRDVLDVDHFTSTIAKYDARIIVLDRRNDVKHAVSRITARVLRDRTGRWNRYEGVEEVGLVEVDPDDFASRLVSVEEEKQTIRDYVASIGRPTLDIDYEDVLADPQGSFSKVLEWIGVRPMAVEGETLKNTPEDLRLVVANFDDLRSRYVGTRYESMFDEGRTA
ncbi:MAG: hypothetical protein ACKO2C_05730 [Actinomycetes bacterium]